jgi:hypothetical protein
VSKVEVERASEKIRIYSTKAGHNRGSEIENQEELAITGKGRGRYQRDKKPIPTPSSWRRHSVQLEKGYPQARDEENQNAWIQVPRAWKIICGGRLAARK